MNCDLATPETVRDPERYALIRSFNCPDDSTKQVVAIINSSGGYAVRCRRGGLIVSTRGTRLRLTHDPTAKPLRLTSILQLLDEIHAQKGERPDAPTSSRSEQA